MPKKKKSHLRRRFARELASDDSTVSREAIIRLAEMAEGSPRKSLTAMRLIASGKQLRGIANSRLLREID